MATTYPCDQYDDSFDDKGREGMKPEQCTEQAVYDRCRKCHQYHYHTPTPRGPFRTVRFVQILAAPYSTEDGTESHRLIGLTKEGGGVSVLRSQDGVGVNADGRRRIKVEGTKVEHQVVQEGAEAYCGGSRELQANHLGN